MVLWKISGAHFTPKGSLVNLYRPIGVLNVQRSEDSSSSFSCQKPLLRLQKMIFNVRGYDVEIRYIPGCKQVLADTLSRASLPNTEQENYEEFQEVHMVLAVSDERYEEFQKETKTDPELQAVLTLVKSGWPDTKQQVPVEARPYWTFRDEVGCSSKEHA